MTEGRRVGFETREGTLPVVDLSSLPGVDVSMERLVNSPPIHPAHLAQLPEEKVHRAEPETDPAQTDRLAKAIDGED